MYLLVRKRNGELIWFSGSTSERNWDGCDLVGPMMPKLVQNCKRRSEINRSVYVENTNVMLRCWKCYKMKVWNISNQFNLTGNTQSKLKLGRLFLLELAQVCLNLTKIAVGQSSKNQCWWKWNYMKDRHFCIWVFSKRHWRLAGKQGRGRCHLYSSLPFNETSEIYQQFCNWDCSLIFSVAAHAITRLSVNKIYQPLGISIKNQISPRQMVDLFPHRLSLYYPKNTTNKVS